MKEIISRKQSNKGRIVISRNNIPDFLKDTKDEVFKKYFLVPPEVPDHKVILDKINIVVDPIYLGGRYYKFKRNVGQTPWIIDGVSVSEHNVQDIIFDAVSDVLGLVFCLVLIKINDIYLIVYKLKIKKCCIINTIYQMVDIEQKKKTRKLF